MGCSYLQHGQRALCCTHARVEVVDKEISLSIVGCRGIKKRNSWDEVGQMTDENNRGVDESVTRVISFRTDFILGTN